MTTIFGGGTAINLNAAGTLVPETFTCTDGQTVFNITSFIYTPRTNSIIVFLNGTKQRFGVDYEETSSSSFTLTSPVTSFDVVEIIGFPLSDISQVVNISDAAGSSLVGFIQSGTGAVATISGVGFSPDMVMTKPRSPDYGYYGTDYDRLRGVNKRLTMNETDAENTVSGVSAFNMDGYSLGTDGNLNNSSSTYISWNFRRAPSFFDEVCYTGNSAQTAYNHNLGVAPELVIVKVRNVSGESWPVWCIYGTQQNSWATILDGTNPYQNRGANLWGTTPTATPSMTSTTFRLGNNDAVNVSGNTYVAYLFATCAGVSKVGSYTGTGALQTVNCGFTSGARFVLIKRTDSTGGWYIYDSTRGITSGNDPYLFMNGPSQAAQVTGTNYVDTDSTGFKVTAAAPAGLNASGGTYIFLAIA